MNKKVLLPRKIKVKVTQEKSGVLFAELPEYEVFTEADNVPELIENINDLVYTYFDVPERDRGKVLYMPPFKQRKRTKLTINLILFHVLTEPDNPRYSFVK